ncbi:diguanylate cyclase response regulator [Maricaulis sp. W15]|uniref:diguanylate cyclase n=1 Tax=Maricaulis maris TaxID=74318 RepID=A0A495D2R3_9PROT|nr:MULTISPECIES: diguanylate cyclase [Maricaulis]OLF71381.1 diguanylate cyclase response regulator [Maricaulis sp. W15]RKQ96056.1 response regulator receiver modulated diguanylate cyclase [Maricaulis maris]
MTSTDFQSDMASDTISVLICENSSVQLRILSEAVRQAGYSVQTAGSAEEALRLLQLVPVDIFLTGIEVGVVSGLEACWSLKSNSETESVYTIVVTASGEDRRLEESLDAGADDFIRKPVNMTELRARLRAASRLVRMQKQFRRLAETDALTGAANRRAFMQYLDLQVQRASNDDLPLSVIMIDLDFFKAINDTHGHAAGDKVLIEAVAATQGCLRTGDMLGRIGGEEFCVILPGAGLHSAALAGERIRAALEAMDIVSDAGAAIPVTASLGVASLACGDLISAPDALLQAADTALYRAKESGRNRVVLDGANDDEPPALQAVGL